MSKTLDLIKEIVIKNHKGMKVPIIEIDPLGSYSLYNEIGSKPYVVLTEEDGYIDPSEAEKELDTFCADNQIPQPHYVFCPEVLGWQKA